MKNGLSTLESEVICCLRRIPAYDRLLVRDVCLRYMNGHQAGRRRYSPVPLALLTDL